jgi:FPC/CPF motif-containing protein YcgG
MTKRETDEIIQAFHEYLHDKAYPCVAARAAMERKQVKCMVSDHMACPHDDRAILGFLYDFVQEFRQATTSFHTAAVIFKSPAIQSEDEFDSLVWRRLQALANLDAENFAYDKRVDPDPASANFSFSLGEEAFFIIGLHPASSRASRRFTFAALVFNPHEQFQQLRNNGRYENMKQIVRLRDVAYSGSINPMLADFGQASEVFQYSGRQYTSEWKCPLNTNHAKTEPDTPEE